MLATWQSLPVPGETRRLVAQHRSDCRRRVMLACRRCVPVLRKCSRNSTKRLPAAVYVVVKLPGQRDQLLAACSLGIGLPAFAFAPCPPRPLTCSLQLGNGHGLIELGNRTKYLPDQFRRGAVIKGGCRTVGGYQRDPQVLEYRKANLLHHEIAGKAIGGFDDHCADAVAGNPREQCGETRPRLDG